MEFLCQFDVREILGQGSFCEVKRCIDKRTRQAFAVKEMNYDTEEQRERIEQEIEVSLVQFVQFKEVYATVSFKKLTNLICCRDITNPTGDQIIRPLRLKYSIFFEHVYTICSLLAEFVDVHFILMIPVFSVCQIDENFISVHSIVIYLFIST